MMCQAPKPKAAAPKKAAADDWVRCERDHRETERERSCESVRACERERDSNREKDVDVEKSQFCLFSFFAVSWVALIFSVV